jgi:ubiquitin-like protein 4
MPKSFSRPQNLAPGQERSVTVQLKSLRNPPIDLKLTSQPLNTSVLDLKLAVSERTRIPTEKLKLLHKKKPVADSKVLKELVGEEEKLVDFSIMVIGGAAAVPTDEEAQAAVETQPTGAAALETDHFWGDLKGFLTQRLKDEKEADELTRTWRSDWQSKR